MSASSSRHENTAPVVTTTSTYREPEQNTGEAGRDDGEVDQIIDDEEEEEEEDDEPLLPPPDFKPFFTLIEDPLTNSHHHPNVHYVFADDDQDIITDAALSSQNASERIVIVDMARDGKEVISTTSLSPDWQGLTSKVTQAPSWGDATDTGVMLRISGQEVKERKRPHDVPGLIRVFDERLEDLSGILGAPEDTTHVQAETAAE